MSVSVVNRFVFSLAVLHPALALGHCRQATVLLFIHFCLGIQDHMIFVGSKQPSHHE